MYMNKIIDVPIRLTDSVREYRYRGVSEVVKTSDLLWQDIQHQGLFSMFDKMKEEQFDHKLLEELQLYATHHFSLEEAYMAEMDYPQTKRHVKAHDRFREELSILAEMPQPISLESRGFLAMFLEEWLNRHILSIDKELEQFILDSSQK